MTQLTVVLLFVLAFNCLSTWAAKNQQMFSNGVAKYGGGKVFDSAVEKASSDTYNVITSFRSDKRRCMKTIRVSGKGIGDAFYVPCSTNGVASLMTKDLMIYGDPDDEVVSLFSDSPNTMIVYSIYECAKRTYKTVDGQTIGEEVAILGEECTQHHDRVKNILKKSTDYLDTLNQHGDETDKTRNVFNSQKGTSSNSEKNGDGSESNSAQTETKSKKKQKKQLQQIRAVLKQRLEVVQKQVDKMYHHPKVQGVVGKLKH